MFTLLPVVNIHISNNFYHICQNYYFTWYFMTINKIQAGSFILSSHLSPEMWPISSYSPLLLTFSSQISSSENLKMSSLWWVIKIYHGALFKTVHINAFFPHLVIPNNFAHLCGNRVLMSYWDVKPDVSATYTQKSTENHSAENWRKN